MTRKEHWALWSDSKYVARVEEVALALNSDGCTGVPDFYILGCYEHDIAYETGLDPLELPIDKPEADRRLRWYIQKNSAFGRFSPMSWWRWLALKYFGGKAWRQNKQQFPNV